MLKRTGLLLLTVLATGGCLHGEADDRGTHSVKAVREAMEEQGLPLRPPPVAQQLALVIPQGVRNAAGNHITGYVMAYQNLLSTTKPSYLIIVIVFDSAKAADDVLEREPEWGRRGPRTALFQKDNVVAVYGGTRTTDGLRELRAALAALPGEPPLNRANPS